MSVFIQYEHHGKEVWVIKELKGQHRNHCLCYSCAKFLPDSEKNCHIAKALYSMCSAFSLVTPVYECPEFEKKISGE